AGGPHCLKYGVNATHVLALEGVLGDGQVIQLGSPGGEAWGPDLVGLFVGSEGNFGVATRITVRLLPVPRAVRTLLADFPALRTAGEAVSAVIASGIVPAALEMMDHSCIQAVEDSVYAAGYPRDAAAVLLVELDGRVDDSVAADAASAEAIVKDHAARSVRAALDARARDRLRRGRRLAAVRGGPLASWRGAPSPGSTALGSTSCATCPSSSTATRSPRCAACDGSSIPRSGSTRGRWCPCTRAGSGRECGMRSSK